MKLLNLILVFIKSPLFNFKMYVICKQFVPNLYISELFKFNYLCLVVVEEM